MTAAADALNEARKWLGATEQPPGSNHVPGITDWYGFDGAWCDMAVSRWLTDAGIAHRCAWVPAEVDNAAAGVDGFQLVAPADIAPGDLLCHNFPGGVAYDHIDMVEARDGDTLTCIDGNWSDRCMRVLRNVNDASIQGGAVVRPPYVDAQPAPTPAPEPRPPAPSGNPWCPLAVDGVRGPATVSAVQWSLADSQVADLNGDQLAVDGEWGALTASALQRYLGVAVDGDFGPVSTRALQRHVGAAADGSWGPDTTRHLQVALNQQTF